VLVLGELLAALDQVPSERLPEAIGALETAKAVAFARLAAPNGDTHVPLGEGPTLNVGAAAQLLGISPTALRRLVARGEVPVMRFGRRMVFRRETLDRLRAERERGAR
jgi:excisionase family DNA binding protein